ncbi:MAG: isoprenylcysteine carboxylmethyltransferase family protein [Acidobacteriota bacterium]
MGEWTRQLARLRVPLGFVAGVVAVVLATPGPRAILAGTLVAFAGEAVRVWAAGHLEKGREVTTSGPYRFAGHPLYVGSAIMALGVVIASASLGVAVVVSLYFGLTVAAAIRTEEAFLQSRFGAEYSAYRNGARAEVSRPFSWARVRRNREWRALLGLAAVVGLLTAKMFLLRRWRLGIGGWGLGF